MSPITMADADCVIRHLGRSDALVVGASLHGVTAAIACARRGMRTVLAMATASPGSEIGAAMGAWLTDAEAEALPDPIRACLLADAEAARDLAGTPGRLLHQTAAIVALEDLLLDAGVTLYYDIHPAGLLVDAAGAAAGVLLGGKAGLVAATAPLVVDASLDGRLALTSGRGDWQQGTAEAGCSATFLTAESVWKEAEAFAPDIMVTRRGRLASFTFTPPPQSQAELWLRERLIARLATWNREQPTRTLTLERAGDDILLVPARRLRGRGLATPETTGIAGFYCMGPVADEEQAGDYLTLRTAYCQPAWEAPPAALPEAPAHDRDSAAGGGGAYRLLQPTHQRDETVAGAAVRAADPYHDEPVIDSILVQLPDLPVAETADLIVIGGGTSGQMAACQAARLGLRTLCVEKHADVGGINTIGGVPSYWYGRRTPYFKRLLADLKTQVRQRDLPVSLAVLDWIVQAGGILRLRTPTVGVVTDGGAIRHTVSITADGLVAFAGRAVIDASGDGDVAAWAGAPYSYGSERDEITMWCSFGSFRHGKQEAFRQYMSVVDQRSTRDTARAIIAGRRMFGPVPPGEYLQHFLASRESRHIHGHSTVNYHDVMMQRRFPDTVLVCKSNIDIKGMASSRAVLGGYIEPQFHQNYEVGVPYGALRPPSIRNLLVIGKAYSITHDALAMGRMQPDMMCMGAVAAMAVAQVLATQPGPPALDLDVLDLPALQATLLRDGILLPGDQPAGPMDERLPPPDDAALIELLERLDNKPCEPSEWARILSCPERTRQHLDASGLVSVPALRRQLRDLASILGDASENTDLLAILDKQLRGDSLPVASDLLRRHDMPDHGFAPEPVYRLNRLAWTRDPPLVTRLRRVAELIQLDPAVSDYRFCYVHSIAYCAELLATPEAGTVALSLMQRPSIADSLLSRDEPEQADPRASRDFIAERYAYLGLCLARAAARCGLAAGYHRLADYTRESRLYLARSARHELAELLATDHAFAAHAWHQAITQRDASNRLPRRPQTRILA